MTELPSCQEPGTASSYISGLLTKQAQVEPRIAFVLWPYTYRQKCEHGLQQGYDRVQGWLEAYASLRQSPVAAACPQQPHHRSHRRWNHAASVPLHVCIWSAASRHACMYACCRQDACAPGSESDQSTASYDSSDDSSASAADGCARDASCLGAGSGICTLHTRDVKSAHLPTQGSSCQQGLHRLSPRAQAGSGKHTAPPTK